MATISRHPRTKALLSLLVSSALAGCGSIPKEDELDEKHAPLVGGTPAWEGLISSTVFYTTFGGTEGVACSGTRVGAKFILTAAHCLSPAGSGSVKPRVYGGATVYVSNALEYRFSTNNATAATIEAAYVHPSWTSCAANCLDTGAGADVAVLQVSGLPDSIPSAVVDLRRVFPGEEVMISGYGCEGAYTAEESPEDRDLNRLKFASTTTSAEPGPRAVFRTLGVDGGGVASVCPGDSGAPVRLGATLDRIVGINSFARLVGGANSVSNGHAAFDVGGPFGVAGWLAGLASSGLQIVAPGPAETRSAAIVFDANAYASFNPDLAANGVAGEAALRAHWLGSGLNEGRRAHPDFHVAAYAARHADLRAAFDGGAATPTNWAKYVEHYVGTGYDEGRNGRP